MKRYTSLWALLKDIIFGCPEQKQQERVDKAVEAHAEAIGDLQYARTMRAYYSALAAKTDPTVKWWDYANAKEKEQDYDEQFKRKEKLVDERSALVDAALERLAAVRSKGG